MTSKAILDLLFVAADDVGRRFDHRDIAEWPLGLLRLFMELGILRRSAGGLSVPCPRCDDGHVETVVQRPGPDGLRRFFIYCPKQLRLEVSAELCRRWEVDLDGLAHQVSSAMRIKGNPKAIVPDRLWRLGRIPCEGKTREIVLATRLVDPDGASIAARVGVGGRTVVLVPHRVPDDRLWPGRVPAVVPLDRIAELDGDRFMIDGVALLEAIEEADTLAEAKSSLPIDPEIKKRVVRSQIKAEIKSHLEDDVLVAAYTEYNSMRVAARELTARLGRSVSKDRVARAVQRAGGVTAVIETDDSPSVSRAVASQSRDRGKKFSERR